MAVPNGLHPDDHFASPFTPAPDLEAYKVTTLQPTKWGSLAAKPMDPSIVCVPPSPTVSSCRAPRGVPGDGREPAQRSRASVMPTRRQGLKDTALFKISFFPRGGVCWFWVGGRSDPSAAPNSASPVQPGGYAKGQVVKEEEVTRRTPNSALCAQPQAVFPTPHLSCVRLRVAIAPPSRRGAQRIGEIRGSCQKPKFWVQHLLRSAMQNGMIPTQLTPHNRLYFGPTSTILIPPSKSGKTRRRLARRLGGRQVCRLGGEVVAVVSFISEQGIQQSASRRSRLKHGNSHHGARPSRRPWVAGRTLL